MRTLKVISKVNVNSKSLSGFSEVLKINEMLKIKGGEDSQDTYPPMPPPPPTTGTGSGN